MKRKTKGLKVDITGLMAKAKPGWEERAERLCRAENFNVDVCTLLDLEDQLTSEELERLDWKLLLVERFAAQMAAGMLKGTIKYPKDDYSVEQWFAHLIGEGADQANYQILLADAWGRKRKR